MQDFCCLYHTNEWHTNQIVQYIDLIRQDRKNGSQPYGASWASTFGQEYPWISPIEFSEDYAAGHGTHTAGSAGGEI